ncbi:sensor histidine kinase [Flavobacterium okayamense]|uniref:histidine kinase n=1 Tax=Flavobacterium okayamense TaxID=2830782 RepID=A0ABN6HWK7_9FLAO|nr:HAMP domain-containing sensor histidine kinase [Flavobacterium okayamense]BCY28814.1 two-component sensor histidine kinase [Flavobacterium okayamense]
MIKFFPFSFKNRIAFNYIVSGSILIGLVFFFIFQIVKYSVNQHIDEEVHEELFKHLNDVTLDANDTYLIQVDQWRAREHNSITVNPVFVQFYDNNKLEIDKSPNLKDANLQLLDDSKNDEFINSTLNKIPIRQIQTPIVNNNLTVGYVVVAMSLEDLEIVAILENILLISFPIILVFLFLFARFFAGKSIKPVSTIIETSSLITKDNLNTRIPLPVNKDELYVLSQNINNLLDRIENAIQREKQFTSDASHELRTPLAVIKGTLEVLIRKPRTTDEYNEKINYCIKEVDRINNLVDQLLLLARFENQNQNIKSEEVFLDALLLDTVSRFSNQLKEKNISIKTSLEQDCVILSDSYLISIVFNNLISNAIKYSRNDEKIDLILKSQLSNYQFIVKDNGVGISKDDLNKIFDSFYRSNPSNHPDIKGTGIGLSIVKRLCDLLKIDISIQSNLGVGTTVNLIFNKSNPK